jgi:hypothetical protein
LLGHPRTVYLREADLLPHLDGWLTPVRHRQPRAALDALIAASQDASGAAEALRKVERALADRHRKVAPLPSGAGRRGNDPALCQCSSRHVKRALNLTAREHLTSSLTVERDLRKRPSAQRFLVVC